MRKLVVYRCENKCTDQLCNYKRLCFQFANSKTALFLKSQISSFKHCVVEEAGLCRTVRKPQKLFFSLEKTV